MNAIQERLLAIDLFLPFDAPEWASIGKFTIRSLRGDERDRLSSCKSDSTAVVMLLGDAKGSRVFTDDEEALANKLPQMMINRIVRQGVDMLHVKTGAELDAEKKSSGKTEN